MREVTIYALIDPRTGRIRYVGKTVDLKKRLKAHLRANEKGPKDRWIRRLQEKDLEPKVEVLEKCAESKWEAREKYWIKKMRRKEGSALLNRAPGGVWVPHKKRRKRRGKKK